MSGVPAEYLDAIAAVEPTALAGTLRLHTRGWDSNAVEAGGWVFKFPKRPEAIPRLEQEARVLALIRPLVPLRVPDMVLHRAPMLFSQHRTIPGDIIETLHYAALDVAQRQAMGDALAAFYAALHDIPVNDAVALGLEPKPEWPAADELLPALDTLLPGRLHATARKALAAYADLPTEDAVFGYFDGHGWNMAFDHERGVLNGVYDFADAAIGPRSREFTYSDLTAPDLTDRILAAYAHLTGHDIPRDLVTLRTTVQHLSELAEDGGADPQFGARVVAWLDR